MEMGSWAGATATRVDEDRGRVPSRSFLSRAFASGDFVRAAAKSVFALADVSRGRLAGPKILIYHQVADDPSRQLAVSPEVFRRQLDWLERKGTIVPLESAMSAPLNEDSRNEYVLTFDDGYAGVFHDAYPHLLERGAPFTLYLTTQFVGGPVGEAEPGLEPLTWDQVAEMVASGLVTVGAHTHSHPDLRAVSSDMIAEELDVSNRIISERTGVEPRHFAYPKGYWAETAEPLIRERYDTAVLGGGPAIDPRTDRYRLSRLPIQRADGLFFFKRKLERGLRLEEWTRRRVKRYRNPSTIDQTGLSR